MFNGVRRIIRWKTSGAATAPRVIKTLAQPTSATKPVAAKNFIRTIIGMKNVPELKKAVATVRAYRKFDEREEMELTKLGKELARQWGDHRGPIEWKA